MFQSQSLFPTWPCCWLHCVLISAATHVCNQQKQEQGRSTWTAFLLEGTKMSAACELWSQQHHSPFTGWDLRPQQCPYLTPCLGNMFQALLTSLYSLHNAEIQKNKTWLRMLFAVTLLSQFSRHNVRYVVMSGRSLLFKSSPTINQSDLWLQRQKCE